MPRWGDDAAGLLAGNDRFRCGPRGATRFNPTGAGRADDEDQIAGARCWEDLTRHWARRSGGLDAQQSEAAAQDIKFCRIGPAARQAPLSVGGRDCQTPSRTRRLAD